MGSSAQSSYRSGDYLHYALGKLATTLPTGTVVYDLVGASQPTFVDEATVDSASIVIDYAAAKVEVSLRLDTIRGPLVSESEIELNNKLFTNYGLGINGVIVDDGNGLAMTYAIGGLLPRPVDGGYVGVYYPDGGRDLDEWVFLAAQGALAFRRR
jgi:hypothetical protein